MTEKGAAGLSILVILLLWAAHAAYGYWTDQVGVREEFAVVWPLEVEIETEEEETEGDTKDVEANVNEIAAEAGDMEVDRGFSPDTDNAEESGKADGTEHETGEKGAEDGQPL